MGLSDLRQVGVIEITSEMAEVGAFVLAEASSAYSADQVARFVYSSMSRFAIYRGRGTSVRQARSHAIESVLGVRVS